MSRQRQNGVSSGGELQASYFHSVIAIMLSAAVISALAFSPTTQLAGSRVRVAVDPMMLGRRDALFAGVVAAAMPMAALADGSTGIPTLQKARLTCASRNLEPSPAELSRSSDV